MADGIDKETGVIDVYALLPEKGDSVMIVNCGDHFEIKHHSWSQSSVPPIFLTEEDIRFIQQGRIVWN
jgi:hypothetical protein